MGSDPNALVEVVALTVCGYNGYRNTGDKFEMRAYEVDAWVKSGLVVRYQQPEQDESDKEVDDENLSGEALLTKMETLWDIDMTPEKYLEKYPAGPRAELASRILEQRAAASGSTQS